MRPIAKHLFLIFLILPLSLAAQPKNKNFYYMERVNVADLQGKKIIEFIEAQFVTTLKTKDGKEMSVDENHGYLITYRTVKGTDLGINGVLIDKNTGELVHHEIGTRDGLKFEKIRDNKIYLKSKKMRGNDRSYDIYLTCKLVE